MKELKAKVTVVVGGMAGSEGKGKVAGYLALHDGITHAICNFMPNAGHTWRSGDKKVMVQTLPQAVVNPHTTLMISAGSAIEPELLENELKKYGGADRLIIHPRAMVVTQEQREKEKKKKKLITIIIAIISFLLACIIAFFVIRDVAIPLSLYNNGVELLTNKQYTEAINTLTQVYEIKDTQ